MNTSPTSLVTVALFSLASTNALASVIDGRWRTTEGEMTLTVTGSKVTGRYTTDNGEIDGSAAGNLLTGYWIEDASNTRCPTPRNGRHYWGKIRFEFTTDGFQGTWGYCDAEPVAGNKWSGTRLGGASAPATPPVDPVLFDNWNRDLCGHTNRSTFELASAAHLRRMVAWVQWTGAENELGFVLYSAGKLVHTGTMRRGSCDTRQPTWCEAVADLELDLQRGFHFVEVARVQQCQNAGSKLNGFLRIHGRTR